jgi:hypothetical protein
MRSQVAISAAAPGTRRSRHTTARNKITKGRLDRDW